MTRAHETQASPLVRLEGASVTRGGTLLLHAVYFKLMPGARWAVLGENGAGKTTLLSLLRGDILPDPGGDVPVRVFDLPGCNGPQATPLGLRQRLALVSGDMQDLYAKHEWAVTALEAVLTGFYDTPLLYAEPLASERKAAQATLAALGLAHLSERRMASLSSGQGRAVLLARALCCRPAALLLDESLEGLDAPARREFLNVLDRAAQSDPDLALLFCSHRTDDLPHCLTDALVLQAGHVRACGPLAEVLAGLTRPQTGAEPGAPVPHIPGTAHSALALALALAPVPAQTDGGFLARITDADVVVGGAHILRKVSWTIRPGEHWAVLGKNGAGKSTLLSLLAGDFWPSALTGEPGRVEYGFATPGETLDDTRRRVGRVSAALDRDYGWDLRVDEVVWTGAHGSIGLYAEPDGKTRARAELLLDFFGAGGLAARRIQSLSRGQLRRVMLARALMGFEAAGPALLLLDEPMAGLDTRARRATRELLGRVAEAGAPLVLVTHHERDLPEQVNRVLVLDAGEVVFSGDRSAFAQWRTDQTERTARTREN